MELGSAEGGEMGMYTDLGSVEGGALGGEQIHCVGPRGSSVSRGFTTG